MCNTKLNDIQGKLDKLLSVLPEIQNLKIQVATLEKEKEELKESLESTQAEVEVLKQHAGVTATDLKATTDKIVKLDELERRVVKQECCHRRNNIKLLLFFNILFTTLTTLLEYLHKYVPTYTYRYLQSRLTLLYIFSFLETKKYITVLAIMNKNPQKTPKQF